ncbi:MAG TPA: hypothetical protein VK631_28145, partial [Solirubrobacteraceae bacterium]|nr:hypothetical protein [Solirubrobacteraceae bacterium]
MDATRAPAPIRSRWKIVPILAVALFSAVALATSAASGQPATGLQVERVAAADAKSIEVTFDRELDPELLQLVDANRDYLTNFIRISGGSPERPDAALDGRTLNTVPGTTVSPVDTPARDTVRIVFGAGATLTDAPYELWFDGGADSLGDLYLRGADGSEVAGATTPTESVTGTSAPAAPAAIEQAVAVDSRVLRVTFNRSVLSGMPLGRYSASAIRLVGPSGTANAAYVQHLAGTDRRQYEISFTSDMASGTAY